MRTYSDVSSAPLKRWRARSGNTNSCSLTNTKSLHNTAEKVGCGESPATSRLRFKKVIQKLNKVANQLDKTKLKIDVSISGSTAAKVGIVTRVDKVVKEVNLTMVIV